MINRVANSVKNTIIEGKWITSYIELPEGHDVADIDVSAIRINDKAPDESGPTSIGDYDNDGIPDLMVKFVRAEEPEVQGLLEEGDNVEIIVEGGLSDGTKFVGSDTIRVIGKEKVIGKGKK